MFMLINRVKNEIASYLVATYNLDNLDFQVMSAKSLEDGDFFTNVCLKYATICSRKPLELAQELKSYLESTEDSKYYAIEVKTPGFLNFFLTKNSYTDFVLNVTSESYFPNTSSTDLVTLEYLSPNTNKPLHIGHVRNLSLGTSLSNILKNSGSTVRKAIIFNDRGLHIMKSVWGYLFYANPNVSKDAAWKDVLKSWESDFDSWKKPTDMEEVRLKKSDFFVGHWYVVAESSEIENKEDHWGQMLVAWENSSDDYHQRIRAIWSYLNDLFYNGFWESAENFKIDFDDKHISYESKIYNSGKQIVLDGVEKGLFDKLEDGAVKADLSKYSLPDKILIRKDGTSIYMTFDIELTRQRTKLGAKRLIWVVGSDQDLYFQQLFATCEMLGFSKRDTFTHYSYGMVALPEGKMSSRKGTVVFADDLYTLVSDSVSSLMSSSSIAKSLSNTEKEKIVHEVSLGALKWTMLSVDPRTKILFDLKSSISITGFSGPYIQYTHARANSVVSTFVNTSGIGSVASVNYELPSNLTSEEEELLRNLAKYPEIIEMATAELAPHYICHYLFSLAQSFNTFYNSNKIISSDNEAFRVVLTATTMKVLKHGLNLLGIHAPEKM